MATKVVPIPFNHVALRASLRAAQLREVETAPDGACLAYGITLATAANDVLNAIGSYRERYGKTPEWFEWRYPHLLVLGPHR